MLENDKNSNNFDNSNTDDDFKNVQNEYPSAESSADLLSASN